MAREPMVTEADMEVVRKAAAFAREEREGTIKAAVAEILIVMGLRSDDEGTIDTPRRVAEYLLEFSNTHDYNEILGKRFSAVGSHGMVVQSGIPFRMLCEHHLVPALGRAAIGYIPNKHVIGLSKLTRLVQAVGTERPSLQEYICDRIANILNDFVEPKGAIVVVKAEHGCMACRGINTSGVVTATSSVRGLFLTVPPAREEFFSLVGAF